MRTDSTDATDPPPARALVGHAARPPRAARAVGRGARARVLAHARSLLAAAVDDDGAVAAVAQLLVPELGDLCVVDVLDEEHTERVRRVHVAFTRRDGGALARGIAAHTPRLAGTAGGPVVAAIRGGGTGIVTAVDDAVLDAVAGDDGAYRAALAALSPTSLLVVPLVARGRPLGALTFWMAESQRQHAAADLVAARDIAALAALALENARLFHAVQRASLVKSNFLAAMSHELRTPLTAVLGYTELIADGIAGPVTPAQEHHLGRIAASGAHLLSLVNEILDFSRAESGEATVQREETDAGAVSHSALAIVEPLAGAKGLALRVELPPAPALIHTDTGKLRQILINLLGNAVKFTDAGEVALSVRIEDGRARFAVRDSGIGIAPENLERIFDPFWQVVQSHTRRHGGSGLGLSLVRTLVRAQGGDVRVESTLGRGSTFTVDLPAVAPPPTTPAPAPPADPRR